MPKAATKEKPVKAEKAKRAKKDPNAPKRALSAYMFFSQDWRERIKTENPDAGFGEVGKLLGAKWKELDDAEKKVSCAYMRYVDYLLTGCVFCSHTLTRLPVIRSVPMTRKLHMMFVDNFFLPDDLH